MRERNTALAAELGWAEQMSFVAGSIIDAPLPDGEPVDVVLALHACDTATDDALAQAVRWDAPVVLASPCCHHDLQRQMSGRHARRRRTAWSPGTRSCANGSATCSPTRVRAALLRRIGYRVEVVQFVSAGVHAAQHDDPRGPHAPARRRTRPLTRTTTRLCADWGVTPHLQTLLADDLARR